MQDDPTEEMQNKQVKENNADRKRAMAKERSRRLREKKTSQCLKIFSSCGSLFSLLPCGLKYTPIFFMKTLMAFAKFQVFS